MYGAARFSLEAGRERIPQARALLLPSLNLTANAARQDLNVESTHGHVECPEAIEDELIAGNARKSVIRAQLLVIADDDVTVAANFPIPEEGLGAREGFVTERLPG